MLLEALDQRVYSPLTPLGQCQHVQRVHPAKPSKAKRRDGQTQALPLNCAADRAGLAAERKEAAAHRASLGTAR